MRFAMRLPRHLSVAAKFVITFLSILTASMGLMGFVLYHQASQAAIEQGKILMMQNVLQMKGNISQKVGMVQNLSEIIAFDPKIQNFLGSAFLNEPFQLEDYRDNIAPILDNLIRQNAYIHSIRIYVRNPSIPELYDGFYHLSRIESNARYAGFIHDIRQVTVWQDMHPEQVLISLPGRSGATEVFSYDRKIFSSRYADMAGMLEIEVDRNVLFESLHNPKDPYHGDIIVIDRDGAVISGSGADPRGVSIADYGLPTIPDDGVMNRVMNVRGVRSIVISTPLEGPDLRMVGIFPVKPFIAGMKQSQKWVFIVLVAALLMLSAIVYVITSALLRRMRVLVKAMREVREGSLAVSVPIVSHDEFTQMALSFNMMTARIHDLVESVYKSRIVEKEAELRALESQINPHFLYNTLATISWVARKVQSPEITSLSNSLAKFYRLVLNKGKSTILVRDEIEMVRVYAQIQKFRFENLFDVRFDASPDVLQEYIPKNILQPLVENALSHGIEPKRDHGTIIVKARSEGDKLVFQVIDDGVGMSRGRVQALLEGQIRRTSGSGYAVKNIMDRLKGYYGEQVGFDVCSRPGIGTSITITLPKE